MQQFKIDEMSVISVKSMSTGHGKVGDSVPSHSYIVNRHDDDDAEVTPHHNGQKGSTPGASLIDATSIYTVTASDPGAERTIPLHKIEAPKPVGVVYQQALLDTDCCLSSPPPRTGRTSKAFLQRRVWKRNTSSSSVP